MAVEVGGSFAPGVRARLGPPGLWATHLAGRPACLDESCGSSRRRKGWLHIGLLGVAVREPVESGGSAVGCYGLMIVFALVAAIIATFGLVAPEKNDLDIAITAER